MNSQQKCGLLPLSARNAQTLPVREYSLPTYKIRQTTKIKINLRRLPKDFFQSPSSMPEITPLGQIVGKFRAKTHETCRFHRKTEPSSLSHIGKKNQSSFNSHKERLPSPKTQKSRRASKSNFHSEPTHENSNTLNFNWTFSKQLFQDQKTQFSNCPPKSGIPSDILDSSKTMIAKLKQNSCTLPMQKQKKDQFSQNVTCLLTEKIAELNVNRLKKNVRKNNHPQSYLQYVKKQCT